MNKATSLITILFLFNTHTCNLHAELSKPIPEHIYIGTDENSSEEKLVEETPSMRFPGVIELNSKQKKKEHHSKYLSISLLVFNLVMFASGMALVKSITGQCV